MVPRIKSYWNKYSENIMITLVALAVVPLLTSYTNAQSDVSALEQKYPGISDIVAKVKAAIASKSYFILEQYIQKDVYGRALSWDNMKSDEPEELSYESMDYRLYQISKDAKLSLTGKVSSWDTPSYVYIETHGWKGGSSHLVFLFHYKKDTKQWFWIGINEGPLKQL